MATNFSGIDPFILWNKKYGLTLPTGDIHPLLKVLGIGDSKSVPIDYAVKLKIDYEQMRIILVGCGGTGSHLLPNILQYCWAEHKKNNTPMPEIILCDGDVVESKNLVRQRFTSVDLEMNKAAALARRYSGVFGIKIKTHEKFLTSEADLEAIAPLDKANLFIGAVDNHRARAIIWQYVNRAHGYGQYWVDAGNEGWHGQVVLGIRTYTDRYTHSPHWTLSKIGEAAKPVDLPNFFDEYPEEILKIGSAPLVPQNDCARMVEADPQTIQANMMSAFCATSLVIQVLSKEIRTSKIVFDAASGNTAATFLTKMSIAKGLMLMKESRGTMAKFLLGITPWAGEEKASDYVGDHFPFLTNIEDHIML